MEITEYERHQLFAWFEEHMGQERAATMVNLLPPTTWADVATKRDLAEMESRMTRTFVTWLIAGQAVTLTAVGIVMGVLLAVA